MIMKMNKTMYKLVQKIKVNTTFKKRANEQTQLQPMN